jgi:hypothetical protein
MICPMVLTRDALRVSDRVLTFLQEEFGHYLVVVRHEPQRFALSTIEYE